MHYFLLIRLQRQQPTHRQSSMGSAERTNPWHKYTTGPTKRTINPNISSTSHIQLSWSISFNSGEI